MKQRVKQPFRPFDHQRALVALIAVGCASCTDFVELPRDICGNGIIEAGEDCDSEEPSCVRCELSCATVADCPSEAYGCGNDGLCHAPSGVVTAPSSPIALAADSLRISDVDHDGAGDVVGVSQTSIVIRHGDRDGALARQTTLVTPVRSGPASFGDLDRDGHTDVLLPTLDGIVALTSTFGALSTAAVRSSQLDVGTLAGGFMAGPQQVGMLAADQFGLLNVVFDFANGPTYARPCDRLGVIPADRLDLASVDIYHVNPPTSIDTNTVTSFLTTSGELCVMSLRKAGASYAWTDITPANAVLLGKRPVLVDLATDNDHCPSLINSDGATLRVWTGATVGGRCGFVGGGAQGTAMPAMPFGPPIAIGHIPASGQANSADLVATPNGVFAFLGTEWLQLYFSLRPLAYVGSGDFNGDGTIDAVLAGPDRDLDIMLRVGVLTEVYRVNTSGVVRGVAVADYDGNGLADVAYTQRAGDHDELYVAYGTTDRLLAPVLVGTFANAAVLAPLDFPDTGDIFGLAEDLAVYDAGDATTPTALTVLHGSPQRTLVAYIDPRDDGVGLPFERAIVGDFDGDRDATGYRDIVAVALSDTSALLWTVHGSTAGLDASQQPAKSAPNCLASGPCLFGAQFVTWPATDGDRIIVVDGQSPPTAGVVHPKQDFAAVAVPNLASGVPATATVRSLHVFDADGDGANELVASFGDRKRGAVRVCTMTPAGQVTACHDVVDAVRAVDPEISHCDDAAPGTFGSTGRARDLIALCHGPTGSAVFRITGVAAERAVRLANAGLAVAIDVGDVTGDGVDDIVLSRDGGFATLRQCTARDTAACSLTQEAP